MRPGTLTTWTTGTGQVLVVHRETAACKEGCVVHHPSDHTLSWARTNWRDDTGIMERVCPHGIGHPDPDSLAHVKRSRGKKEAETSSIHGCDGCCRPVKIPQDCPAFQVTVKNYTIRQGAICEGFLDGTENHLALWAYTLDNEIGDDCSHDSDSWWTVDPQWVLPLTRAARQMLALATNS